MSVVRTLSRFRAVLVVVCGTAAGIGVPELGRSVAPFTTLLVAVLVFASLHGVEVDGRSVSRTGTFVAATLATSYLLLPALVAGVAPSLLTPTATGALLVVVAAPTTAGSALVWTTLSRGDGFLATVGAVVSLLVAPVAVPVILSGVARRAVSVPVVPIARTLALVVGTGGAAAWLVPEGAVSERAADRTALLAVFLLLYASIAVSDPTGMAAGTLAVVAGCALVTMAVGGVVGAAGVWTGRLSRAGGVALLYASTLKNLGISLAVAAALGIEGVVVVVTFYAVQQLASGSLATALGRGGVGGVSPTETGASTGPPRTGRDSR